MRHGFTLVEMLVSIAILALLVVLLCTIMNSTSTAVGSSWSRLESDEDGRLVLDRLQLDLQNMLIRPDVDYELLQNTGNDSIAFYATAGGYTAPVSASGTKRVVSVINYKMGTSSSGTGQPILERGSLDSFQWQVSPSTQMVYSSAPTLQTTPCTITNLEAPSTSLDIVSNDIFRFEVSFLLNNPTNQSPPNIAAPALVATLPTGTTISNVAAIVVTVAEIDSQNSKIIPNASWSKLVNALADSATVISAGNKSTAQYWNNQIASSTFATTAVIPQKAAAAIRVYERYYYLTTPPSQANL